MSLRALLAVLALGVLACAPAPPPPASPKVAPSDAPSDDWTTMSWEDKHSTMTWGVLPRMARLFQRHHGTKEPELTCRSCHGADAEEVAYKMPHGLAALDPRHLPDPRASDAEGRMAKFMIDEVMPEMADAIGVAPGDAATGSGFGCFTCHPTKR